MKFLAITLMAGLVQCAMGQGSPVRKLPEFAVATVKPVDPNTPHRVGIEIYPGARVVLSGLSLKALVGTAFQLSYWQMSGGDDKVIYDIEAKPAENAGITNLRHTVFGIEDERLREMLQALLIDRFQLRVHRETRTGDVYVLTRTNKPLALRAVEAGADPNRNSVGSVGYAGGRWVISNTDMPGLAKFASDYILRAPVHNQTELTGLFNYRQTEPDLDPNYSDNTDSFLRQISEVGLKLEKSKGPVEILVIDGASKLSSN